MEPGEFFSIRFCPYQSSNAPQVFAAVSKKHAVVCKIARDPGNREVFDTNESTNCCCTWAWSTETNTAYLCIGGVDGIVKIYNVITGQLVEGINDLSTSPDDPSIIASASDDTTVRIWSLDPVHKEQPCLCILAGEGHIAEVLSASIHDTGRYAVSGGHDHRINFWVLPEFPNEPVESPIQVHYPHFSTSAIHGGIVDCVAFYGDQILSKANRDNIIILWEIVGFSSQDPIPSHDVAPLPQIPQPNDYGASQFTRSAFIPATSPRFPLQYDRRLQFHTPRCDEYFFLRFELYFQPGQHPILTFCNRTGEIFFWDLERVREYGNIMNALRSPSRDMTKPIRLPSWIGRIRPRVNSKPRGASVGKGSRASSQTPEVEDRRNVYDIADLDPKDVADWNAKYGVMDRDHALEPHYKVEVKFKKNTPFLGRQASWSPGGEWCTVAGSGNAVHMLKRWSSSA
ncbi:polycomb protein EED [Geosmithia morbida]|uniref:Polycomb protein EED n=1 Tax=Geosmithia morbida TaxID=1094350 RepID=A0A9P5D2P3_9HYPO|nr:polycomb protein EED [Geosmithia morbida]KAF4125298.1 polycomb protein EED [Geosmithia morbida]